MSTSRATSKSTKAEAAKAKAEEAVKATAAAIIAEGQTEEAKVSDAITTATTAAEAWSAGNAAITYLTNAEADAFGAILFGRHAIARAVYAAYVIVTKAEDANAEVKAASDLTWTKVAAVAFRGKANTKEDWTAAKAKGRAPMARAWSALEEDWRLYVNTADGRYRDAYDAFRGDDAPTIRGYLAFAAKANAKAKAEAGEKGTPQSRAALTKAASKKAAEAVAADIAKAKKEREDEAAKAASDAVTHATTHPAANVVAGFSGLTGRDLTSCFDVDILTKVAKVVLAWRDHVKAMTAEEVKAAKVAAGIAVEPDSMTTAAVTDVAKAEEAEADASADDIAAIVAAVMAAKAEAAKA